jgi:lipoate-protein ligase A
MAKEYWRLINSPAGDGFWNMAVDEMLLEEFLRQNNYAGFLRIYAWRGWWVSLGYHQQKQGIFTLPLNLI